MDTFSLEKISFQVCFSSHHHDSHAYLQKKENNFQFSRIIYLLSLKTRKLFINSNGANLSIKWNKMSNIIMNRNSLLANSKGSIQTISSSNQKK
uniref:Zinc finger CCCH domain-containing protein 13 isoform X1 n=1 Tax=Rhizophora mucronata TaxID=61149 RepID=A0A2P2MQ12_RHIMU